MLLLSTINGTGQARYKFKKMGMNDKYDKMTNVRPVYQLPLVDFSLVTGCRSGIRHRKSGGRVATTDVEGFQGGGIG